VAQIAHLDACRKAGNTELYAICDAAEDLRVRMQAVHQPTVAYADYAAMLADPRVEAVIVAVADQFHAPLCRQALEAGKHVLVEKPLSVTIEECQELCAVAARTGLVLQVGTNRRFDPGVQFAARFIQERIGRLMAVKAWYCDSTLRYTMTDNLQPIPVTSPAALKPAGDPKANRSRYFLLTHGSHLVDLARLLGGPITRVRARFLERFEAFCWFIDTEYASGTLGHLDLTVPLRGDFEEGFRVYGEHGSVRGRLFLPWFHKAGEVECFSAEDGQYHRPLGEDAHTYRRQIEAFARHVLEGQPSGGSDVTDGLEAVRALVAIARSVETGEAVALSDATGGV